MKARIFFVLIFLNVILVAVGLKVTIQELERKNKDISVKNICDKDNGPLFGLCIALTSTILCFVFRKKP